MNELTEWFYYREEALLLSWCADYLKLGLY